MLSYLNRSIRQLIAPADNAQVVVLGHQKSGTTAIAALLARIADLEVSVDPLFQIDQGKGQAARRLITHPGTLGLLCRTHPQLLTKSIVKDPDLTFIFPTARKCYRNARFLFVVRDPRDVIRSICNRLGLLPTDWRGCPQASDMKNGNEHWEMILSGRLPRQYEGVQAPLTFVANLAYRWNRAAQIFLGSSGQMVLLKYEDFVREKEQSIAKIAADLGLAATGSIKDAVDVQYQPKGNSKTDWPTFFGRHSLCEIESICRRSMSEFGYREVGR